MICNVSCTVCMYVSDEYCTRDCTSLGWCTGSPVWLWGHIVGHSTPNLLYRHYLSTDEFNIMIDMNSSIYKHLSYLLYYIYGSGFIYWYIQISYIILWKSVYAYRVCIAWYVCMYSMVCVCLCVLHTVCVTCMCVLVCCEWVSEWVS